MYVWHRKGDDAMNDFKIIFVDDDVEVLRSFKRDFHNIFNMDFAQSGGEALESVRHKGPYSTIVVDYRMPEMDGIELLGHVREISPDTSRIVLTGFAQLDVAIKAINEGAVFRFLTKPVTPEILRLAINDGNRFHSMILAERELNEIKSRQESLQNLVTAFSTVIEMRDPYTAGHQNRVAYLSCAIGSKLGLSMEEMHNVRMAATIHDIGKIYVPSEFLNKPGKLSDGEFNIIKSHPEIGFEILNSSGMAHPIGDIIHQHHEKLDGSGYPQGLLGNDISLAARIITVADVVEAMESHRPYRASLGRESALCEINDNKGTLFDPDVVACCLELFRQDKIDYPSSQVIGRGKMPTQSIWAA